MKSAHKYRKMIKKLAILWIAEYNCYINVNNLVAQCNKFERIIMKSKLSKSMAICLMFVAIACLVVTGLLYSPSQEEDKEYVKQETTVTNEVMSENNILDMMEEMTVLEIGKTDYFAPVKDKVENLPQIDSNNAAKLDDEADVKEESVKEETKEETKEEIKEEVKEDIKEDKEASNKDSQKPSIYDTMAISIADTYVNIREKAATDAKVVGKFYKNAVGTITATEGDWYKIESGNAVGYVKAEYVATKDAAKKLYPSVSYKVVKITADSLNVRKEMNTTSKILTKVKKNETYNLLGLEGDWAKIKANGETGYVKTEYATISTVTQTAKTIEEEKKEIEEQKRKEAEEAAKKQAEKDKVQALKDKTPTKDKTTNEGATAYNATDLEMLIAVIHCEAGYEPYEGKVALANIVLNRVRDRRFPNTIRGVLYQKGQFTVVKTSKYKKTLTNYKTNNSRYMQETIKAAKAALAGENNIGKRVFYNGYRRETHRSHKNPLRIGNHLFWEL